MRFTVEVHDGCDSRSRESICSGERVVQSNVYVCLDSASQVGYIFIWHFKAIETRLMR